LGCFTNSVCAIVFRSFEGDIVLGLEAGMLTYNISMIIWLMMVKLMAAYVKLFCSWWGALNS